MLVRKWREETLVHCGWECKSLHSLWKTVWRFLKKLKIEQDYPKIHRQASQVVLVVKNLPDNAGDIRDAGLIPGLGRSPGGGHGKPLQYSCLRNPMDRGAWRATVPEVTKNQT